MCSLTSAWTCKPAIRRRRPECFVGRWPAAARQIAMAWLLIAIWMPVGATPRVITLTPHATEMVFAAGAGEMIVATVDASDFPQQAQHIPRFGDGIHNSLEEIVRWEPDIVVGWPSPYTDRLQQLGIPVILTSPATLEAIPQEIERIGKILGTGVHAERVAAGLREQIEHLYMLATVESQAGTTGDRAPVNAPLIVIVLASPDGRSVMGADPLLNQVIELCGGINPFGHSRQIVAQASLEGIISTGPVLIVSGSQPTAPIRAIAPVSVIDPDWLYRPGPRFVLAARQLCQTLFDRTRQNAIQ